MIHEKSKSSYYLLAKKVNERTKDYQTQQKKVFQHIEPIMNQHQHEVLNFYCI